MAAVLLGVLGALALLLAAIGVYGVVSHAVASRTRELGIRLSLGATPRAVTALAVRGGMVLVLTGGVLGLLLAMGAASLLSRFLMGVEGRDLATFTAIPALPGGVALVSAWLPARRAARVDPAGALREG